MQGVPADLPVDQERIRARLLQMSATNQKSSQINTTHIYCIESQTWIKRTVNTKNLCCSRTWPLMSGCHLDLLGEYAKLSGPDGHCTILSSPVLSSTILDLGIVFLAALSQWGHLEIQLFRTNCRHDNVTVMKWPSAHTADCENCEISNSGGIYSVKSL